MPTKPRNLGPCAVCGNVYDKAFEVVRGEQRWVFDCLECAVHEIAPTCDHCECRIIGHGMEKDGRMFCCAHCAEQAGVPEMRDRA
jgi:hypothetical protein